jgi:hypothetical protein
MFRFQIKWKNKEGPGKPYKEYYITYIFKFMYIETLSCETSLSLLEWKYVQDKLPWGIVLLLGSFMERFNKYLKIYRHFLRRRLCFIRCFKNIRSFHLAWISASCFECLTSVCHYVYHLHNDGRRYWSVTIFLYIEISNLQRCQLFMAKSCYTRRLIKAVARVFDPKKASENLRGVSPYTQIFKMHFFFLWQQKWSRAVWCENKSDQEG